MKTPGDSKATKCPRWKTIHEKTIHDNYNITPRNYYRYSVSISDGKVLQTRHDEGCCAVTGYDPGEYGSNPLLWYQMIYFEDREMVMAMLSRLISGQEINSYEHRILHKDGPLRWVRNTPVPKHDAKGVFTGYDGLIEDITDRKEMADSLAKVKNELEELFNTISDAITVHDMDYNILLANNAASRLLDASPLMIRRLKCFELYHGTSSPPSNCPCCELQENKEAVVTDYFEPKMNRHIEIKAFPRFDKHGNIVGLVHVVKDITERKQYQEHLMRSQKLEAVAQLAGGIAHDFNNIMTGILGYTLIIKRVLNGNASNYEDIVQIEELAKRAAWLTRGLLTFSRQEIMTPEIVDLNTIIMEAENLMAEVMGDTIECKITKQDCALPVLADVCQLKQVLLNLATNARDAMPEGGVFTISTDRIMLDEEFIRIQGHGCPGLYAILTVSDTGSGINDEILQKIFNPFFTTKDVGKGTGLGLAAVYGIIKQHDGYINVDSVPDNGATFSIYLPLISSNKSAGIPSRRGNACQ
jgi:PAS domain S-box-containing protein